MPEGVVDRAVRKAPLPEPLAITRCFRFRLLDRRAFSELRLCVPLDLARRDLREPVFGEEGEEVVDERPAESGNRLCFQPFLFALREPL